MGDEPFSARHVRSIADIPRQDWQRLFPGRAEGWDYFRACERVTPEGFSASAMSIYAGDRLLAAAPLFRTDYRLDLSLEGNLKPAGEWLYKNAPKFVVVPVLGIGSPLTEEYPIGFAPGLEAGEHVALFEALLAGLDAHAEAEKIPLLALKDVTDRDATWAQEPLKLAGFTGVATLPLATLHLPFKNESEYLASLSASMRSDVRKKMRRASKVTIEIRDSIDGVEEEIVALFEETKANKKADYGAFDEVPARYFREVMRSLPGCARLMLCRVEGVLATFNIFLIERERIIGKYVGMRYPLARQNNLYFINWMATARLSMERGIPWLQTGHTSYRQKGRGCKLKRSWIYFRYRNPLINPLFKLFGPMMAFDAMDPDLQALGANAPYLDPGDAP
jgi:Acetyltransferase (GNAT) domain